MYFVWYDDNPKKSISLKIEEAICRYQQRYGCQPDICLLNEAVLPEDYARTGHQIPVKVMPARNVPQNYFWVGNEAA